MPVVVFLLYHFHAVFSVVQLVSSDPEVCFSLRLSCVSNLVGVLRPEVIHEALGCSKRHSQTEGPTRMRRRPNRPAHPVGTLVERFDIEPFSDFSAK